MEKLKEHPEKILLEECKDGHLYLLIARNARLGIYQEKDKGFTISRNDTMVGDTYLFVEDHWDANGSTGTAIPIKDFGLAFVKPYPIGWLEYLNKMDKDPRINVAEMALRGATHLGGI